jgi:hypothetical protein
MAISTTQANAILDYLLRGTEPATIVDGRKLSLHTGAPGADGTSNEVSGGSYARQSATFDAASAGAAALSAPVEFAGMPAATVSHVAVWTDEASPIYLMSGALSSSKTVPAGETFRLTEMPGSLS